MWKDFLYFSKGQRIGILVLISLIILALVANYTLPYFFANKNKGDQSFLQEAIAFKRSLVSTDSVRQAKWQQLADERQRKYNERFSKFSSDFQSKTSPKYTLFNFDPNTTDSVGFVRLGLKNFVASNILKYRTKGGRFKTPADFGKVYGISAEKYKELEPYISIQILTVAKIDSSLLKKNQLKSEIIVELNTTDTALLMQVKGIGRAYAKGIVRFRREAGGFVSIDQLREIYGMSPENFERIRPFCSVNQKLIQQIKVNSATVQRLKIHPYINFYQAKALYEFRREKVKLKSISELSVLSEFSTSDLERLSPYLNFE